MEPLGKLEVKRIRELMLCGLKQHHPKLRDYRRHFVIEGSILCNIWFTEPLLDALRQHLHRNILPSEILRYYLNASNAQILENISKRAKDDPRRQHEREKFKCESDIARYHRGFDNAMAELQNSDWIRVEDRNELERLMREALQG